MLNKLIKKNVPHPEYKPFENARGCFLLLNLTTQKFEKEVGDACQERLPPCSTFKVPLSVMAFDSKVLKVEKKIYKWDGRKRMHESWNKNHDARSWMNESVVWFSQKITPKMGEKKFKKYLKHFIYVNQDISTGIKTAWLNSPGNKEGSLAVTSYEQADFMKKFWLNELPVSKRSMELIRQITFLETSPNGFKLSGKKGSNFYDEECKIQLGWFISHISNDEKEYILVTQISDLKPADSDKSGEFRAKAISKRMLEESGLW